MILLVDSNVFLVGTRRGAFRCMQIISRLGKVSEGQLQAAITDFHVDSILVVMAKYGKGRGRDLAVFLASLLKYKGLKIHHVSIIGRIKATYVMRDYKLDIDDAIAVQAKRTLNGCYSLIR